MTEQATLIWHRDPADVPNRDWIRLLLSDVVHEEVVDLEGRVCLPYSVVVEDTRCTTPPSFFAAAARQRQIGLFHIADQYFSFDYKKYQSFDFIIKTHWSSAFDVNHLLVVPIGYESDMPFQTVVVPASRRPLLWSFAGVLKSSRYDMVEALRKIKPHSVYQVASRRDHLPPAQYVSLLEQSIFAPCPMGNVMMESFRLYESLEAGCIPLVETRPFLRYYETLLGHPPFIFVSRWGDAEQRILDLASDLTELDRLQQSVHRWWKTLKAGLKERVTTHVADGFARADQAEKGVRVKRVATVPGWHYAELLRHQSVQSLRWRFNRNLLGGRLRVPY